MISAVVVVIQADYAHQAIMPPGESGMAPGASGGEKEQRSRRETRWFWVVLGEYNDFDDRIGAASPDIDFIDHVVGLTDVEDLGRGSLDGGGDVVDDEGLAHSEIVDVVLGGGDGLAGGGVLVGLGAAGDRRDGGGQSDTYLVRVEGGARERESHVLIDGVLHHGQDAGGGDRSDGVYVAIECSGAAVEDHILDAGNLEKIEADGVLVRSRLANQFEMDAVTVGFVVFLISARPGWPGSPHNSSCVWP